MQGQLVDRFYRGEGEIDPCAAAGVFKPLIEEFTDAFMRPVNYLSEFGKTILVQWLGNDFRYAGHFQ